MVQKKLGARYEGYLIGNIAFSHWNSCNVRRWTLQVPENCSIRAKPRGAPVGAPKPADSVFWAAEYPSEKPPPVKQERSRITLMLTDQPFAVGILVLEGIRQSLKGLATQRSFAKGFTPVLPVWPSVMYTLYNIYMIR
jgi:hypothetical protein